MRTPDTIDSTTTRRSKTLAPPAWPDDEKTVTVVGHEGHEQLTRSFRVDYFSRAEAEVVKPADGDCTP
jgi:hypothetical protein